MEREKRKRLLKGAAAYTMAVITVATFYVGIAALDRAEEEPATERVPVASTPIYTEVEVEEVKIPVPSTPIYTEIVEKEWYTEADIIALAKMVWGEARGVKPLVTADGRAISSKAQQAATIWCVLNRYDAGYSKSIKGVVTPYMQFTGYKKSNPATKEFIALAEDVLNRWIAEKEGMVYVGRTLPSEYLYFAGKDGYNRFRIHHEGDPHRWDWTLPDPYVEQEG